MQIDPPNTSDQDKHSTPSNSAFSDQPTSASERHETSNDGKALEIVKLEQELAELKDKYVRAHAEMENMRRRQDKERADLIKFGLESVFKDLLPVLDSFEKALSEDGTPTERFVDPKKFGAFADGMVMVRKQLLEVCRRHGLEAIDARNVPFDPNLHQAIQKVESSDVAVDTVGSEFARGYQLHGRLLRPAMVSVLTPTGD